MKNDFRLDEIKYEKNERLKPKILSSYKYHPKYSISRSDETFLELIVVGIAASVAYGIYKSANCGGGYDPCNDNPCDCHSECCD